MDGKFEQGYSSLPHNAHIPAFYQQMIHQQNQPSTISANPHTNLLKQGNQFESNSSLITSVKNTLLPNSNDILNSSQPLNIVFNQNPNFKEQAGMSFFSSVLQQPTLPQQNIFHPQLSQAKNILPSDIQLRLLGGSSIQPLLTTQNNSTQQFLVSGVHDSLSAGSINFLQPAQIGNGKQEITHINFKLQNLNLQNEANLNQQQNLLMQQQQQQSLLLQQQQSQHNQLFLQQNPQLLVSQNVLKISGGNFNGAQNDLISGKEMLIAAAPQVNDLQYNDQARLINYLNQQQLQQQLNQNLQLTIQPNNNYIHLSENAINKQLNAALFNGLEVDSQAIFVQQQQQQLLRQHQLLLIQQQQQQLQQQKMEANQQFLLTSLNETPNQFQKVEVKFTASDEAINSNSKLNNNLQYPIMQIQNPQNIMLNYCLKDQTRQEPCKYIKTEETQSSSSDKTINIQQKGLQLTTQYSNTLSPQRASNPSIQSLQQYSSLTQTEKFEEGQQFQNIQKIANNNNLITSLLELESQQPLNEVIAFSNQQQQQKLQAIQFLNSVQQNNKIVPCIHTSNNTQNNSQINLQNKSLISNSNQCHESSIEDSEEESKKSSIKQLQLLNGEKNGISHKLSSQSSSNSSPLKCKSVKKEQKLYIKQNEKRSQQHLISSENIQNQHSSDSHDKGSKDLSNLANRRNNEDPYQNYNYDSQIKNQLRKQVLKCFFKNVPAYLDKYESEIARQFPCLEKNTLKSLCKYWSQFDNPTKRENLKNDEYKSLCDTLEINHEIKPLGQKGIKEVFCKKNDFSEGLKYLYTKFNDESSTFSKRQRQVKMKQLYVETSEEILDDIFGRQKRKDQIKSIVSNEDIN